MKPNPTRTIAGIALIVIGLALMIHGCRQKQGLEAVPESLRHYPDAESPKNYAPPEFSTTGRQDYGTATPQEFAASDPGNEVDLDGDGIVDFVKLGEGGRLMWSKGRKDGTLASGLCVLVMKDFCRGYYVRILPDHKRPTLLFWDANYHHFRQECIGTNSIGVPVFGDIEQ